MPPLITQVLLVCVVLYFLLIIIPRLMGQSTGIFWKELLGLVAGVLVLRWSTGFPSLRESFSAINPIAAIVVMFVFVLLGMIANYLFYLRGQFELISFTRPLLVSPIVLLPLVGSIEPQTDVAPVQLICLAILAFQNGFFWRTVFEHVRPRHK